MSLRFHLDEHVANAVASALRRRAINVTTTVEANLLSQSDEDHLAYALREVRVVYTQDDDFLIAASQGTSHAGIVYNPPGMRTLGQIINFLILLDAWMSPDEMRNHVEFVTE